MNKTEAMERYWRFIKEVQMQECVCQDAARKYYRPLKRVIAKCAHAESDEEFLYEEINWMNIVSMMQRYDKFLESQKRKDI